MTAFLIASGLLTALILALLLPPLLRKRQWTGGVSGSELSLRVLREQHADLERELAAGRIDRAAFDRERLELERRAIEDGQQAATVGDGDRRPWLAGALVLVVPLVAAGVYWQLGTPAMLTPAPTGTGQASHAVDPRQIEAMAMKLAERLQDNPQDGQGWLMLARSYVVLRRYGESAAAFGRATSLLPGDANLLTDYADTLAMAQGRRLSGEPERLIAQALQLAPNNIKALALSGTVSFEQRDYAKAIARWEQVIALVPADSGVAKGMLNSIADARSKLGGSPPTATATAATGSTNSVSGVILLDQFIQDQGKVAPTDTVFIFARAIDGPRMPLAMLRKSAAELPLRFRLDDSMAMAPNAKLSDYPQVIVGARISRSGDALPKPGDIEGFSAAVKVGSQDVRIVIDKPVSGNNSLP